MGWVRVKVEVDGKRRRVKWWQQACPGCGRAVMFLPEQPVNRCGWCGREVVRRGLAGV